MWFYIQINYIPFASMELEANEILYFKRAKLNHEIPDFTNIPSLIRIFIT